jgi:hypothetical protein
MDHKAETLFVPRAPQFVPRQLGRMYAFSVFNDFVFL